MSWLIALAYSLLVLPASCIATHPLDPHPTPIPPHSMSPLPSLVALRTGSCPSGHFGGWTPIRIFLVGLVAAVDLDVPLLRLKCVSGGVHSAILHSRAHLNRHRGQALNQGHIEHQMARPCVQCQQARIGGRGQHGAVGVHPDGGGTTAVPNGLVQLHDENHPVLVSRKPPNDALFGPTRASLQCAPAGRRRG